MTEIILNDTIPLPSKSEPLTLKKWLVKFAVLFVKVFLIIMSSIFFLGMIEGALRTLNLN